MKEQLTKIWDKDKFSDQIMYLMTETFAQRRLEMKGFVGRPMFKLCANYLMLKESRYVGIQRIYAFIFKKYRMQ